MRVRPLCAAVALLSLFGPACRAQDDLQWVEQVPFGLSIFASPEETVFRDTLTLFVDASALAGHGPTGAVHVSVPAGLELVSGDTTFTLSVRRVTPPHQLRVRPLLPGTHNVVGTLLIKAPAGDEDFFQLALPIGISGDTLTPGAPEIHRIESVIGGHRFRHGGRWWIPMHEGETFDIVEFERAGSRIRPIEQVSALCSDCSFAGVDTVVFVSVVDHSGKVIQAHALGLPGKRRLDTSLVAAARKALMRWRFEPAKLGGRAVNDWTYVRVPVRSAS